MSNSSSRKVVVLGTGGTIAGKAAQAGDNVGYTAAQVAVGDLVAAIPGLAARAQGRDIVSEQVAQLDSKDMDSPSWARLAARVAHWTADPWVDGVIVTHGTDTLEETAWFLEEVLAPAKPVVFACAMRPATALAPDGPQNLLDAVAIVLAPQARGVVAVCAGTVHGARHVAKVHPYRIDAFGSGDAGPLGFVEEGVVRMPRGWPAASAPAGPDALERLSAPPWPRVEIVLNHAGASGAIVRALTAPGPDAPVAGIVVAGTGNGSVHEDLEAALLVAERAGVRVVRTTRCAEGEVIASGKGAIRATTGLSPVKARVSLMLDLLLSRPAP